MKKMEFKTKRKIYINVEMERGTACCTEKIIKSIVDFNYEKTGMCLDAQDRAVEAPVKWVRWAGLWDGYQWNGARISCTSTEIRDEFIEYFKKCEETWKQ